MHYRRLERLLGSALLVVGLAACDGDSGGEEQPDDTTAPEISDVAVVLAGSTSGTLDLSSGDAVRILTAPAEMTFRVLATDDTSATEGLSVALVDPATLAPLPDQAAVLAGGLWRVTATAEPGVTATVRVTDEAGLEATWPHAAVFPSREEALARDWTVFRYDANGVVLGSRSSAWSDGTWCTEGGTTAAPSGGSYAVEEGGDLRVEVRHATPCDEDVPGGEWDTVEARWSGPFHVDQRYLSRRPLERLEGDGADLAGEWAWTGTLDGDEITERLTLGADGALTWETVDGAVREGSWEVVPNDSYEDNFGDLLILEIAPEGGAGGEPETEVHFHALREGLLLLDPVVDAE